MTSSRCIINPPYPDVTIKENKNDNFLLPVNLFHFLVTLSLPSWHRYSLLRGVPIANPLSTRKQRFAGWEYIVVVVELRRCLDRSLVVTLQSLTKLNLVYHESLQLRESSQEHDVECKESSCTQCSRISLEELE